MEDVIEIIEEIKTLAMEHYDPDAVLSDKSPADMHAWSNGLIVRLCNRTQYRLLTKQSSKNEFLERIGGEMPKEDLK